MEVAGSSALAEMLEGAAVGQVAVSVLPLALLFQAKESWLFDYVFLPCDGCDRGFVHKDEREVE